jgi:hypothetical protein
MALHFTDTRSSALDRGIKCIVHGRTGAGKTKLFETCPRVMIASAEKGTLSIANAALPMCIINNRADLDEFYNWCIGSVEARNFDTFGLDSVSEMAEKFLYHEKHFAKNKDIRAAYGEMQDAVFEQMRRFRDIPDKHVYFVAKTNMLESTGGMKLWSPMLPGVKASSGVPYFFDLLLYLGIGQAPDPKRPGEFMTWRYLQTGMTPEIDAKDRSGVLDEQEPPHLGNIFAKIRSALDRTSAQTVAFPPPPIMMPPPPPRVG